MLNVRAPGESSFHLLHLSIRDANLFASSQSKHSKWSRSESQTFSTEPSEAKHTQAHKQDEFLFSLYHVHRVREQRPGGRTILVDTAEGTWHLRAIGTGSKAASECKEWARLLGGYISGERVADEAYRKERNVWDVCILHGGSYESRVDAAFLRDELISVGLACAADIGRGSQRDDSTALKTLRGSSALVLTSNLSEKLDVGVKGSASDDKSKSVRSGHGKVLERCLRCAEQMRVPVVMVLMCGAEERQDWRAEEVKQHFISWLGMERMQAEMYHYVAVPAAGVYDSARMIRGVNAILGHARLEEKLRVVHPRCGVAGVDLEATLPVHDALLKKVVKAVEGNRNAAMTVLFGKEEVGKTTLVRRLANADGIRQRFCGGVLFMQCQFLHKKNRDSLFASDDRLLFDIHYDAVQLDAPRPVSSTPMPKEGAVYDTIKNLENTLVILDELRVPEVAERLVGLMEGSGVHLLVTTTTRKKKLPKEWKAVLGTGDALYVPSKLTEEDAEAFAGRKTGLRELPLLRMTAELDEDEIGLDASTVAAESVDLLVAVAEVAFDALSAEAKELLSCLGHFFEKDDLFSIGDVRCLVGKRLAAELEVLQLRGLVKRLEPIWLPLDPLRFFPVFALCKAAVVVDFEAFSREDCIRKMSQNVSRRLKEKEKSHLMQDNKLLFLRSDFPRSMERLGMVREMSEQMLTWMFVENVLRWGGNSNMQWALGRLVDCYIQAVAVGADPFGPIGLVRTCMVSMERFYEELTDDRDVAEFLWNSLAAEELPKSPELRRFLKALNRHRRGIVATETGRIYAKTPYFTPGRLSLSVFTCVAVLTCSVFVLEASGLPVLSRVVSKKISGGMELGRGSEVILPRGARLLFYDVSQFYRSLAGVSFADVKGVRLASAYSEQTTKKKGVQDDSTIIAIKRWEDELAVLCKQSVQVYTINAMLTKGSKSPPRFTGRFTAPHRATGCIEVNQEWVVALMENGDILFWSLREGSNHVLASSNHRPCSLALLGHQLVVGTEKSELVVWQLNTSGTKILRTFDELYPGPGAVTTLCCAFTEPAKAFPPQAVLCTGGVDSNTVHVFNRMHDEAPVDISQSLVHSTALYSPVLQVYVTTQDAFLFVVSKDCSVTVWRLSDSTQLLRHDLQVQQINNHRFGLMGGRVMEKTKRGTTFYKKRELQAQVVCLGDGALHVRVVVHVKVKSSKCMLEAFDVDLSR